MPAGRLTAAEPLVSEWLRVDRQQRHMGTSFSIVVYVRDREIADLAIEAAFARIRQLDVRLSDYRSDSEVRRLAASAPHEMPVTISDDLHAVLLEADRVCQATDGAFDVTVGPLTRLWRKARRQQRWPAETDLRSARQSVGARWLVVDREHPCIRLTRPGMSLDLGGIAKGYALDCALEVLYQHQVERALVNGGGDVIVGQPPPGKTHWRVGIVQSHQRPDKKADLQLSHQAVATSGDLWQYFEHEGQRYSHLVDPRTGMGGTRRTTATVVAATGIAADAWASALCVLGAQRGLEVIAEQTGIQARVASMTNESMTVVETAKFSQMLYQAVAE